MRPCTVCAHQKRATIDDALLRNQSCAKIADQVGLSKWAIGRHSKHLDRGQAVVLENVDANVPLVNRIESLIVRIEGVATAASLAKQWHAASMALREVRGCLELLARIHGLLQSGNSGARVAVAVSVNTAPSDARTLSSAALDEEIAIHVRDATNGFDPREIERLKELAETTRPSRSLRECPL